MFHNLPQLETERLVLRKLTHHDAQAIFEYASDPEVPKYMTWDVHRTIDDTHEFLNMVIQSYDNLEDDIWTWGIALKDTDKIIGCCTIWGWPRNARAELGYWIGRPHWGQGYVTEAVQAMIKLGFEQMSLNRLEARCFPENIGSARVMEKSGMVYEGTIREQMFVKEKFEDCKLYAILRRDYYKQHGHKANNNQG